jgi:hypothetical protein
MNSSLEEFNKKKGEIICFVTIKWGKLNSDEFRTATETEFSNYVTYKTQGITMLYAAGKK